MNNTTKTILIVAGSLLLVCICAVGILSVTGVWSAMKFANRIEASTMRGLYEVAPMIEEIATITLPEGFGSPYGMHVGNITSVGFASQSKNTHILLTQLPEGTRIDVDEVLELIGKYSANPESPWTSSGGSVIEEKPVVIRGQGTTLKISEGTSSDGTAYRTATATFQGRGGPALVMIAGPVEEWDTELVETFIASIQ